VTRRMINCWERRV